MLNVSLTAKVLGWGKLSTEMNFLPILIATGRVNYSPQVGYHNNNDVQGLKSKRWNRESICVKKEKTV